MSLKDNFNQAVKELLKRDGLVTGDNPKKTDGTPSEDTSGIMDESLGIGLGGGLLGESLNTPLPDDLLGEFGIEALAEADGISGAASGFGGISAPVEPEPVKPTPPMAASGLTPLSNSGSTGGASGYPSSGSGGNLNMNAFGGRSVGNTGSRGIGGGGTPPSPPTGIGIGGGSEKPYFETEETTVISRNTIIDGNIRSFANIDIEGSVKGDVQITKNASLSGKIIGDLSCNNAAMQGSSMQGNVISKGQVVMDKDSLILGDIATQYLDLNGKVRGNLEVGGKAEFKTDAIIFGNINASTITVLDGATIQGFVNTTFLQETVSSVFPDQIAVQE